MIGNNSSSISVRIIEKNTQITPKAVSHVFAFLFLPKTNGKPIYPCHNLLRGMTSCQNQMLYSMRVYWKLIYSSQFKS